MAWTKDITPLFDKAVTKHYLDEEKYVPTYYDKIFQTETMTGGYSDDQLWEMIGGPEPRLPGTPVAVKTFGASFNKRYVPVSYALGGVIPEEWIEDDVVGFLHRLAAGQGGALARSFATHRERLAADVLGTLGFASTTPVWGSPDGQPLFSTAHPISAGNANVTASNRPASWIDLSYAAWMTMRANLVQQMASNNYHILDNAPRVLVVNPELHNIAIRLARQEWEPTYATNEQTRMGMMNVAKLDNFQIIEWPYWRVGGASGSWNAWFVLGNTHYLKWYNRSKFRVKSDFILNILSVQFVAYMRYVCGWTDWRGTYGSKGT